MALKSSGMLAGIFATKAGDSLPPQPGVSELLPLLEVLPAGAPGDQAKVLARRLARKGVSGIHGYFAHTPAEVAADAAERLGIPYGFSAHARDVRKVPPDVLEERARRAACVISCNWDTTAFLGSLGAGVKLLPHGVDTARFAPSREAAISKTAGGEPLRVLAVGRLVEKKGFAVLIRAVAAARARILLSIVGEGPEKDRLAALANELGVAGRVQLLGSHTHEDLPSEYLRSDVVAVPSVVDSSGDRDGLPNVLLEAMACGKPTVASDLAGIRPAVRQGQTGLLVEPGDVGSLAGALDSLAMDRNLSASLGRQAREAVEREWSMENCSGRFCASLSEAYSGAEIAYVMKGYPRRSEPFIASEIRHLEEEGARIRVFAIRGLSEPGSAPAAGRARAPVHYLPESDTAVDSGFLRWLAANWRSFLRPHLSLASRRTGAYSRTLIEALASCLRYRSGWLGLKKVFLKDFLRAGTIADELLRSPSIRHLHGHFCHGSTTMAMYASALTDIPFSFTAHAKDIYLPKLNPGDLLSRKIARATFVATCTDANRAHLEQLGPREACIQTIYHGLDPSVFSPRGSQAMSSELTILSVGRFVAKKGFPHLIAACRILKERGHNFRCRILGEPGDQLQSLAQLVRDLELADTVHLEGPVEQAELREIYRTCTAFVLPCQVVADGDRDGIPNVLVEAMATEVPVISTEVSGIPELIDHGVDGLLVPPSDPRALAQSIESLILDPSLRARLGRAARKKVLAKFDARRTTKALLQLFWTADEVAS